MSVRAPSSPAPTAPRHEAPFGTPRAPYARSAGRCRRAPCPARPDRPCGTGRDPRASPRLGPPGPGPPQPALGTSVRSARSGGGLAGERHSRSSLRRVPSCRLCSSAHSFHARVSSRQNPSQRRSSPVFPKPRLGTPLTGLKPLADETRRMSPFGSPKGGRGNTIRRGETPEETHVVRLIHPTAEPVPVPIDGGVGEISRRSAFRSTWMARHRWPPSHRSPRFGRPV